MTFKKYKPVNASQRHLILLNRSFLKKVPLIKSKIVGLLNSSGRNNQGKITVRHKGGGIKHKYRFINLKSLNIDFIVSPGSTKKLIQELVIQEKNNQILITVLGLILVIIFSVVFY